METESVLIARDPFQAKDWLEALARIGIKARARATFELESMVGEAMPQRAIDDIDEFDWIVLTSGNGLGYFRRGVEARGRSLKSLEVDFAVVGPATARALASLGIEPAVVAEVATAEGLADQLVPHINKNDRVLVVRPDVSRPVLTERLAQTGCDLHSVPFYRNRPSGDVSEIADACDAGQYDVVVFGAPSAFEHLYVASGPEACNIFSDIAMVAIGNVTETAIRDRGLEVAAVANAPTAEAIADAVARAIGR